MSNQIVVSSVLGGLPYFAAGTSHKQNNLSVLAPTLNSYFNLFIDGESSPGKNQNLIGIFLAYFSFPASSQFFVAAMHTFKGVKG
jgi:hypothetical protein